MMPDFCAAYGCSNERNEKTKQKGITFHSFPSDKQRRQSWTIALRREGFEPKTAPYCAAVIFGLKILTKSGQTVRLRQGATPSIFKFPDHLSKQPSSSRLSRTSNRAIEESPHTPVRGRPALFDQSISDHQYALDPVKAKRNTESIGWRWLFACSWKLDIRSLKNVLLRSNFFRYLSVTGFVINIDSFTMMIPELLEGQRYVCTYRLSQDHLELFFNSIRASGGWNNNPTVAHFQSYFRRIMVRCGIAPGKTGNVQAQDDTMCLSAVDMSSVVPAEDDDDNIASSPFEQITETTEA
ncbi:hypothetical protein UPYG_G00293970 [Umbra pygmaea]|uniref:THAP-type domain-containing protein n=1 Tax=Umbra pygmaea TaxID=75934 RepID=A0ABD0W5Q6_UMBPY